jgi:hypothetical protein
MSDVDRIMEILTRLDHAVMGNGRPGLLDRMTIIEIQQRDCPARLAASTAARQTRIAFAGVAVAVAALGVSAAALLIGL